MPTSRFNGRVDLLIDPSSKSPVFEQLRRQVLEQVKSGELIAGTKIPTVRQLAQDLGIAPNTVAKAYRELETQGVIETRGRSGSFIASGGDPSEDAVARAAFAFVTEARRLGIADAQALEFIQLAMLTLQ